VLIVVVWFAVQFLSARLGRHSCSDRATVEAGRRAGDRPPRWPRWPPARTSKTAATRDQVLSQEPNSVVDRLTGLRPGSQPAVWVPDSTFWLRRARAGGVIDLPETGASLASSPVVWLTRLLIRRLRVAWSMVTVPPQTIKCAMEIFR
jgi:hypothetical protein